MKSANSLPNFSSPLKEQDIDTLVNVLQKKMSRFLKSQEYQAILEKQNKQWLEIYNDTNQILPAVGLNYKALTEHILNEAKGKFERQLGIITPRGALLFPGEIYYPELDIDDEAVFIDDNLASFLPHNIDQIIRDWMKTDEKSQEFVDRINREYFVFKYDRETQERFIYLDIFFTALEMRLNELPHAPLLDEDYSSSIYINPDFLKYELSYFFPFYSNNNAYNSCKESWKIEPGFSDTNNIKMINIYPENRERTRGFIDDDTIKKFTKEYDSYVCNLYNPSKILKVCYPLYFFIYNNILFTLIMDDGSRPHRRRGCKFTNRNLNLSPIKEALELNIKKYKYEIENSENDYRINVNVYALNRFLAYIDRYKETYTQNYIKYKKIHGNLKHFIPPINFSVICKRKKGNSSTASREEVKVTCNLSLTVWLYIRHAELFQIALASKIHETSDDETTHMEDVSRHIVWAKNFITAFNFNEHLLRSYPSFPRKYTKFIDSKAKIIYSKMRHIEVNDWIRLANRLVIQLPYKILPEVDVFNGILQSFFKYIDFHADSCNFDIQKFRKLHQMLYEKAKR